MSSRYTDTEKWQDGWYADLQPYAKLLFNYFCDNCDCAGFMEISKRKIASDIGFSVEDFEGAYKDLARGLVGSKDGYTIFIKNFLKRQKSLPLKIDNNYHRGIIKRFTLYANKFDLQVLSEVLKLNLSEIILGASKPLARGTEKEIEKEKVLEIIEGGLGETKIPDPEVLSKIQTVQQKQFLSVKTEAENSKIWQDIVRNTVGVSEKIFSLMLQDYFAEQNAKEEWHRDLKATKSHIVHWMKTRRTRPEYIESEQKTNVLPKSQYARR